MPRRIPTTKSSHAVQVETPFRGYERRLAHNQSRRKLKFAPKVSLSPRDFRQANSSPLLASGYWFDFQCTASTPSDDQKSSQDLKRLDSLSSALIKLNGARTSSLQFPSISQRLGIRTMATGKGELAGCLESEARGTEERIASREVGTTHQPLQLHQSFVSLRCDLSLPPLAVPPPIPIKTHSRPYCEPEQGLFEGRRLEELGPRVRVRPEVQSLVLREHLLPSPSSLKPSSTSEPTKGILRPSLPGGQNEVTRVRHGQHAMRFCVSELIAYLVVL